MEIWVLVRKFFKLLIILKIDEELVFGYLVDIFDVVFLYIFFFVKERQVKIEVIFCVIDQILDIYVYVIMVSGELFDIVIIVKEVIIEIVIVVMLIVVESIVMVGIEMVVMVLG